MQSPMTESFYGKQFLVSNCSFTLLILYCVTETTCRAAQHWRGEYRVLFINAYLVAINMQK